MKKVTFKSQDLANRRKDLALLYILCLLPKKNCCQKRNTTKDFFYKMQINFSIEGEKEKALKISESMKIIVFYTLCNFIFLFFFNFPNYQCFLISTSILGISIPTSPSIPPFQSNFYDVTQNTNTSFSSWNCYFSMTILNNNIYFPTFYTIY